MNLNRKAVWEVCCTSPYIECPGLGCQGRQILYECLALYRRAEKRWKPWSQQTCLGRTSQTVRLEFRRPSHLMMRDVRWSSLVSGSVASLYPKYCLICIILHIQSSFFLPPFIHLLDQPRQVSINTQLTVVTTEVKRVPIYLVAGGYLVTSSRTGRKSLGFVQRTNCRVNDILTLKPVCEKTMNIWTGHIWDRQMK